MNNIEDIDIYKGVSGIYYILEEKSKRVYVGSSVDMRRRIRSHYNDLLGEKHSNSYMQRAWKKYMERGFSVGVLEVVKDKERLLDREQHWMDFFMSYERHKGFNLSPNSTSNLGFKKTKKQIENSVRATQGTHQTILTAEEASMVKKMINEGTSMAEIARNMDTNYDAIRSIRREHSFKYVDPQIDKNKCRRAKLRECDVIEIKKLLNNGEKMNNLAETYGVTHRTIRAIKNEEVWKNTGDKITIIKRRKKRS